MTDSYYSLLKFEQPDEDLNLDCLAGNFSPFVKYITIYPVKCDARIANAYFCSCVYFECYAEVFHSIFDIKVRKNGIMEQVKILVLYS
jgi:hypothetical protein